MSYSDLIRILLLNISLAKDEISCARNDAVELNRKVQMKLDIIHNEDGPLAQSTLSRQFSYLNEITQKSGIEERLDNLETYLRVKLGI